MEETVLTGLFVGIGSGLLVAYLSGAFSLPSRIAQSEQWHVDHQRWCDARAAEVERRLLILEKSTQQILERILYIKGQG